MIEANNPEIDVDELMKKVREEVAKLQNKPLWKEKSTGINLQPNNGINLRIISQIQALLNNAESKSQVRTEFPEKLNRFPFTISRDLQRFVLKLYTFLFKEQRAVNFSLIQALRESLALNQQLNQQIAVLQDKIKSMDERHLKKYSSIKNDLTQQKQVIACFLDETRPWFPEHFTSDQLQTFQEEKGLFDGFYGVLTDHFRGSREEILARLKVYLPRIAEAKIGTQDSPILDIGCGRGEWLELLLDAGYVAQGLDLNQIMVEQCKTRELDVIEADALTYLQSQPDGSLGAVTGFHLIEHLPFPVLINLIEESVRVLKPGGLVIFETPNPQNVLVGTHNFYLDPSHLKPLPSALVKFMLEHCGLAQVDIINLHPYDESFKLSGSPVAERFNEYFYGSQDYAVIGYKP
ncbi:MAG: class I SAM-dependent methyltransferase [Coleofasciculus sp. G1-WW12-02]|uniref:class I SAM-dependent methyltransferase n=1 Tax=Coleofasciculus sp. G1-WW12-02 TaxID=3068483 RepID=UPI0032F5682E